uniref:Uncharacterized protein n=1 Tax=Rhodnius prolixus TaxID=13249 RepID=T1HQ76_RHOPR
MKEKGFIMILGGCHLLMTNVTLLLTIFTQQQRKGRQQVKILGDQIPILTIWTANGAKRVVCREFFIGNIDALLRNSCQKITKTGIVSQDLRGKHLPHNKLPQATENSILKNSAAPEGEGEAFSRAGCWCVRANGVRDDYMATATDGTPLHCIGMYWLSIITNTNIFYWLYSFVVFTLIPVI